MIETETIALPVKPLIDGIRAASGHPSESHSFASLFLWQQDMGLSVRLEKEAFLVRCTSRGENCWYFPCGDREQAESWIRELLLEEEPLRLVYLREEDAAFLSERFPDSFEIVPADSDSEYLYDRQAYLRMEGEGYRRILPRVVSIIPDTSVIGMLMESMTAPKVVKSTASGMLQHDGFTWAAERDRFTPATLSRTSRLISETLSGWMDMTDDESRKAMTETVFRLLESTGKDRFSDIRDSKLKSVESMAQSVRSLPKGSLQELGRMVTRLGESGIRTASSYIQNLAAGKRPEQDKPEPEHPEESKDDSVR